MAEVQDLPHLSMKIEWKIKGFFRLPQEVDNVLQSPHFTFCDAKWCIIFYPNGTSEIPDMITLYLKKEHSTFPLRVKFKFGLNKTVGSIMETYWTIYKEFIKTASGWGIKFLKKAEFVNLEDVVDQEGTLRLCCTMSTEWEPLEQTSQSESAQILKLQVLEQKEAIIDIIRRKGLTLSEDFNGLLQTKGDTTVRVGDKEFLVHKLVMATCSSLFRDRFEAVTAEKDNDVINIEGYEPKDFEDFLLFLYVGQLDIVKPSNLLKLLFIAVRYNVEQLKAKCFEKIIKEWLPEDVCDTACFAILCGKKDLFETVTEYFMKNMEIICHSPKWFSFLRENPAAANDLLINMAKVKRKKTIQIDSSNPLNSIS